MEKSLRIVEKILDRLKKDWDAVYLIDGSEGIGKSSIGLWLIHYFYELRNGKVKKDDIKHVCLDPYDFVDDLKDLQKMEATMYDEAGDLLKRRALSEFNVLIMKAYQVIRGDNLFTLLVMPSLFHLDSYFSGHRLKGFWHCFGRGKVAYYSQKRLRSLVALNQSLPIKNYNLVKPTFIETFPEYKGVLAEPYAKKKKERLFGIRQELYDTIEAKRYKPTEGDPSKANMYVTCAVCGHEWKPRTKKPLQCVKCRSPNWDSGEDKVLN